MRIEQLLKVDANQYNLVDQNPERLLILAILERAVGDLSPIVSAEIRRSAIAWFKSKVKYKKSDYFSFACITEYLDLNDIQLLYIKNKVQAAEELEERRVQEALALGVNTTTYRIPNLPRCHRMKRRFQHAGRRFKVDASAYA